MVRASSIKRSLYKFLIFMVIIDIMLWPAASFKENDAQNSEVISSVSKIENGEFGRIVPISYELKEKEEKVDLLTTPDGKGCCLINGIGCDAENQTDCIAAGGNYTVGFNVGAGQNPCYNQTSNEPVAEFYDECSEVCCCPDGDIRAQTACYGTPYAGVSAEECPTRCGQTKCDVDCGDNTENCWCGNTEIGSSRFCCWNIYNIGNYDSQSQCLVECQPPVFNCTLAAPISENCICEGAERTSGYCCGNGSYVSNPNGVGCVPIPACPAGLISQTCRCDGEIRSIGSGWCCADGTFLEGASDGSGCPTPNRCLTNDHECIDSNLRGCQSGLYPEYDSDCVIGLGVSTAICCETPDTRDKLDCCNNADECVDVLPYTYPDCSGTPTETPCAGYCQQNPCYDGAIRGVRNTADYSSSGYCYCSNDYSNPSNRRNITTDTGYCCDFGSRYSTTECVEPLGATIRGYVYNITSANKVAGARVIIRNETWSREAMGITDLNGNYTIPYVPAGTFDFAVIYPGFNPIPSPRNATITATQASNRENITRNLNITPEVLTVCDTLNAPSVSNFIAQVAMAGSKAVRLTWNNPDCSNIENLLLQFYHNSTRYYYELSPTATSFIDNNIADMEWGQTYTYNISVRYTDGVIKGPNTTSITLGNNECDGRGTEQFCSGNSIWECNNNTMTLVVNCGNQQCIEDANGASCVTINNNCQGTYGQPLGMFGYADITGCLTDWCYYDYSNTTVDMCDSCSKISSCYDYRSEYACEGNGANVPPSKQGNDLCLLQADCSWYTTTYGELGKGVCFDPSYEGTDYCGKCNITDGLFSNVGCDQAVCSRLGSCYSKDDSCQTCTANTVCEDFTTEASCINAVVGASATNFNISSSSACPVTLTSSNDACGLEKCKWNGTRCFKDANDDDTADCASTNQNCKKDLKAPLTRMGYAPPLINSAGYNITFSLDETGGVLDRFYYCIYKPGRDSPCCSDDFIATVVPGGVSSYDIDVDPVNDQITQGIVNESGIYSIRYYSTDSYKNIEQVHEANLSFDLNGPGQGNILTPILFADYSLLDVLVYSGEFMDCYYSADPAPDSQVSGVLSSSYSGTYRKQFNATLRYDNDALVRFTSTCKDQYGNVNNLTTPVLIDRNDGIVIGSEMPNNIKLNNSTVNIYLETSKEGTCTIYEINGTGSLNGRALTHYQASPVNYTHTYSQSLQSFTYFLKVNCSFTDGKTDTTYLRFTVDTAAPATSAENLDESPFNFSRRYYNEATVYLDCSDQNISGGNYPGKFGADRLWYCVGGACNPASQNWQNVSITEGDRFERAFAISNQLSYYCVDAGGNKESIRTGTILIDTATPTVWINSPADGYITNQNSIAVQGAFSDPGPSGAENVTIIVNGVRYGSTISGWQFSNNSIFLVDGANDIDARLRTNAGYEANSDGITIYKDTIGPVISGVDICASNRCAPTSLESGQDITFYAVVTDAGIGVDNSSVRVDVNCISCSYSNIFNLNNIGGNEYSYTASATLPVGNYSAMFIAEDRYGTPSFLTSSFYVNDTQEPSVTGVAIYNRNLTTLITAPLIKGDYAVLVNVSEGINTSSSKINYYIAGVYTSNPVNLVIHNESTKTYKANFTTNLAQLDNVFATANWNVTLVDLRGLAAYYTFSFDINTRGPSIVSLQAIEPIYNYAPIHVKGRTSAAGVYVNASAWDESGINFKSNSTTSGVQSNVKLTLGLADPYSTGYENTNVVYISRDHVSEIQAGAANGDYLEFSQMSADPKPRFKVQSAAAIVIVGAAYTMITLYSNLTEYINSGTVDVYDEAVPTGYFDILLNLFPGNNTIIVKAKIEPDMWGSPYNAPNFPTTIFDNDSVTFSSWSPVGAPTNPRALVRAFVNDTQNGRAVSGVNEDSIVMNISGSCNFTSLGAGDLGYDNGNITFNIAVADFGCNGSDRFVSGNYNVSLSATDNAANPIRTLQWSFTVDAYPPNITIAFEKNPTNNRVNPITITSNEPLNNTPIVESCFADDSKINVSALVPNMDNTTWSGNLTINVTNEDNGNCAITVSAYDLAENIGENTTILLIDTIPPGFEGVWADKSYARIGDSFNISFLATEAIATSPSPTIYLTNGRDSSQAAFSFNYSDRYYVFNYTVTAQSPEGIITLNVSAYDLAGNLGNTLENDPDDTVVIDKTAPQFGDPSSFKPHSTSIINEKRPEIRITYRDSHSGIKATELRVNGQLAGQINEGQLLPIDGWNCNKDELSLRCTPWFDLINTTATNVTDVTVNATIYDWAGNQNTTEWIFRINLNVPNTPNFTVYNLEPAQARRITGLEDIWYANTTTPRIKIAFNELVNIRALDFGEGTSPQNIEQSTSDNITYYVNVTSNSGELDYILRAEAYKQGFSQSVYGAYYLVFSVDTRVPSLSVAANPSITSGNYTTLNIDYSDGNKDRIEITGPQNYVYGEQNLTSSPIEHRINLTVDGSYDIAVKFYDKANNLNQSTLTVIRDTNEPNININSLIPALKKSDTFYRTGSSTVNVTGNVTINSTLPVLGSVVSLFVNDGEIGSITLTAAGTFGFTNLQLAENSNNSIKIRAVSPSGVPSEKNIIVEYSTEGPVASLVSPAYGVTNTQTPTISINTDKPASGCNLTLYDFYIASMSRIDYNNFSVQVPSNRVNPGSNILHIKCADADLGNIKRTQISLFYDTEMPTINYVKYDNDRDLIDTAPNYKEYLQYVLKAVNLEISAGDNFDDNVKCKRNDVWIDSNYTDAHIQNIELPEGSHIFNITCIDKAGLESAAFVVNITIDLTMGVEIRETIPVSSSYVNRDFNDLYVKTNIDSTCKATYSTNTVNFAGNGIEHYYSGITTLIPNFITAGDNKPYTIRINCSSSEEGIDSDTRDITFTTDFNLNAPTITQPVSGFYTNNSVITVRGTTEQNSQFRIKVNGQEQGLWSNVTSQGNFSGNATLNNGTNAIEVSVIDRAGNENSRIITGYYTNIGPRIETMIPTNEGPFRKVDELAAVIVPTTDAAVNLSGSYIELRNSTGIINIGAKQIGEDTIYYNISGLDLVNGFYVITAIPYDIAGNEGERETATFEISNQVPEIIITSPLHNETMANSFVRFIGDINKNPSENIDSAILIISSEGIEYDLTGDITGNNFDTDENNPALEFGDGAYRFYIAINTSIGNYGESAERYFTVDITGPGGCIILDGEEVCP